MGQTLLQQILGQLSVATPEELAEFGLVVLRQTAPGGEPQPTGSPPSPTPVPAAPEPGTEPGGECVFRLVGKRWKVILFGARPIWLPNILGSRYLDYLLHAANDPIEPFALEVKVEPEKGLARARDSIQAESDAPSRRRYREDLGQCRLRRSQAQAAGRQAEVEALDVEIAALEAVLKGRAIGGDTGERARNNVRKAIAVVMKQLWQGGPEERAFAQHLRDHLRLGYQCLYSQPQGRIWG